MSSLKETHIKKIWDNAEAHYEASKVGLPNDMIDYHLCECCDQPIRKDPIPLDENTKEFQIFGFGYPLYFSFLKYCIVLVLMLVASRTGTSIYMATKENFDFCYGSGHLGSKSTAPSAKPHHLQNSDVSNIAHVDLRHFGEDALNLNLQHETQHSIHLNHQAQTQTTAETKQSGNHAEGGHGGHGGHGSHAAHHVQCTSFMVYLSVFMGEQAYNNYFLRILAFLMHLITLAGIRNMLMKEEEYYDERTCSLSDYSVIVSNLPYIEGTGAMVRKLFSAEFEKNQEVKELIYVFEDEKCEEFKQKLQKLEQKKLEIIQQNNEHEFKQIQKQIRQEKKKFNEQLKLLKENIEKDYVKCDKIIVILNTEKDKGDVLQSFEKGIPLSRNYFSYFYDHKNGSEPKDVIIIKEAPQPNQIVWEHIDESDTARKALILRGWILTLLFLVIVSVVFYFIMLAKTNLFVHAIELQHHNPNDPKAKSSKMFATIIVFVALFGVILFNKFIMGKVLHKFVHMERHAYTDQEGHSFAMKYSLGMFFTTALMTLAVEAITFQNFYSHQYGVIEEQTIMFFVTAFFIPLVWYINPYNLAKNWEYRWKKDTLVTQQEANDLIEDFPYDLGKRYAQVFEIMWFTFLYCELIPLGSFLILIGLSLYYWVDKYNFLRNSALKEGISGKITILSLKSLDATLFLAPAGRVIFDFIIHKRDVDYLGLIMTALGLLYLVLPISKFINHVNEEKFMIEDKTYEEARYSFKQHYFTLHPVYKLTHEKQNDEFKKQMIEHYKREMKNPKMFGTGRGAFMTEDIHKDEISRVTGTY